MGSWRPHPEQIEAARPGYGDWWLALEWVRHGLVACRMLREVQVITVMLSPDPGLQADVVEQINLLDVAQSPSRDPPAMLQFFFAA